MRMAEIRRNLPVQSLDLGQIVEEARQRWLRPAEICEILRNYKKFHLKTEPPVRPPAGSLFLFDRKALRYFRKDGYSWRKKKDGKTVKEAHEKLKAGSVDVLHCYYAHGEDNKYFQRRSYWMLDEQLENIVLVHYREVEEGHKFSVSRPLNSDPVSQLGSPQTSSVPCLQNTNSPVPTAQLSYASSPSTVDWSEQPLFSEFDDRESGEDAVPYSAVPTTHGSASHNISLYADESTGFLNPGTSSSIWADMHGFKRNINSLQEQRFYMNQLNGADLLAHKLIDAKLDADSVVKDWSYGDRLPPDTHREVQEHGSHLVHPLVLRNSPSQEMVTSTAIVESTAQGGEAGNGEVSELKKLDSFGRWLDKEIGGYCEGSFMTADSGKYWSSLDTENNDKEVSCLSHHMQLDVHSLGPSLSREQLFSIHDFAPDWAYSGVATKVLVIGMFLGDEKHSSSFKWCCMFGGTEVSAEVLTDNVIRCEVPSHDPGRVPFYVTCGNRLACSEVREFEYREKPLGASPYFAIKSAAEDELHFQIRLAKLLHLSVDRKWFDCSIADCDKSKLINDMCLVVSDAKLDWGRIEEALVLLEKDHATNMLIQNLFTEKLCIWLFCKVHEGGKGPHLLDDEGQGVIHLAAALGYEWAMSHIVAAGVSPNFRDARGWTALHWASYYGREGTVVALVTLGAAPGAVNDPIAEFPGGQTAADLASSRGFKGIAGYLAEADLTSLLSSLNFNENALHSVAATITAENALENAKQSVFPSDGKMYDELCLRESLAAVRKSAHAAALIQDAFRVRSFRHRQLTKGRSDVSEVSFDLVALGSLNKVQKMGHFEDYLHSAAIKIQQKYRGWKGRKEFLKIRNRIVKIQAHLRGHQVRKEYKKVVWSVGIVEKAILRWRRRRPGLRGFRMEKTTKNLEAETDESNDEYEFLRIGRKQKSEGVEKALARVQSMARHPEARNQYMRLVTKFEDFKIGNEVGSGSQVVKVSEKKIKKEDLTEL